MEKRREERGRIIHNVSIVCRVASPRESSGLRPISALNERDIKLLSGNPRRSLRNRKARHCADNATSIETCIYDHERSRERARVTFAPDDPWRARTRYEGIHESIDIFIKMVGDTQKRSGRAIPSTLVFRANPGHNNTIRTEHRSNDIIMIS